MWKVIIAIRLAMHGLGHSAGLFSGMIKANNGIVLLGKYVNEPVIKWLGIALWLVALVLYVAAIMGIYNVIVPNDWWSPLLITASIVSITVILIWWKAFPVWGPLIADVVILIGVFVLRSKITEILS